MTATKLRREWGRVYTHRHASKTHIMPSCPYVSERFSVTPVDAYPADHIELCEWCAERFANWRDGLPKASATECKRCGADAGGGDYCRECERHANHMAARRRL